MAYQAAGYKPGIRCAAGARFGARSLHNIRAAHRRPKSRERAGQRHRDNQSPSPER